MSLHSDSNSKVFLPTSLQQQWKGTETPKLSSFSSALKNPRTGMVINKRERSIADFYFLGGLW